MNNYYYDPYSTIFCSLIGLVIYIVAIIWATNVAKKRGYPSWYGLLLGFFLSLVGVLVASILPRKKVCPHCAERVNIEASVCPHCQREVNYR